MISAMTLISDIVNYLVLNGDFRSFTSYGILLNFSLSFEYHKLQKAFFFKSFVVDTMNWLLNSRPVKKNLQGQSKPELLDIIHM